MVTSGAFCGVQVSHGRLSVVVVAAINTTDAAADAAAATATAAADAVTVVVLAASTNRQVRGRERVQRAEVLHRGRHPVLQHHVHALAHPLPRLLRPRREPQGHGELPPALRAGHQRRVLQREGACGGGGGREIEGVACCCGGAVVVLLLSVMPVFCVRLCACAPVGFVCVPLFCYDV